MAKNKKLTPNQKEYQKQINRVNRIIREGQKMGLTIDYSVIPEKPKRITKKQLQLIKAIKPRTIYEASSYVDNNYNIVSGWSRVQQVRKEQRELKSAQKTYDRERSDLYTNEKPTIQTDSNTLNVIEQIDGMLRSQLLENFVVTSKKGYVIDRANSKNIILHVWETTKQKYANNQGELAEHLMQHESELSEKIKSFNVYNNAEVHSAILDEIINILNVDPLTTEQRMEIEEWNLSGYNNSEFDYE